MINTADIEKMQTEYLSDFLADCKWKYYFERTSGVFDLIRAERIIGQFWTSNGLTKNILNLLSENSNFYKFSPYSTENITADKLSFQKVFSNIVGIKLNIHLNGNTIMSYKKFP